MGIVSGLKLRARRALGLKTATPRFAEYGVAPDQAAARLEQATTAIERLFYANTGRITGKWLHYLPIYERYFASFRGVPFRMLEIGVARGGSLDLWRSYFGSPMTLFGIDIDPACAAYVDPPNRLRIGSQADPAFLRSVVAEMGGLDIVVDDGSHIAAHQRASFDTLFPLLSEGGIYMIEDTHTSYWAKFGGGYRRRGTAIEFAKALIDDMHGPYHYKQARRDIAAITFHDSIIVIEKRRQEKPAHIQVGKGADAFQYWGDV